MRAAQYLRHPWCGGLSGLSGPIGLDDNLRDDHGFDSIDAIELLGKIELILGLTFTRKEKENAMGIRTINDILDYGEAIQQSRKV